MNGKVAFRNLLKHPFLNLVKVIGLSLALSGIIFIALFLKNELRFDRYHEKSERIYRYTLTTPAFFRVMNPGYVPDLKEKLLKYQSIESVLTMLEPPGGEANDMFPFEMEGYQPEPQNERFERIGVFPCDYSFASLFKLNFTTPGSSLN